MLVDNRCLDDAVRLIGDRWSLLLVGALLEGDRTFGELAAEISGIAPSTLSARLRALHHDGLVTVRPYELRPVRMRYSITDPGRRLGDALTSLADWGARRTGRPAPHRHAACGSALETRPWCPTCERVVDDHDGLLWC